MCQIHGIKIPTGKNMYLYKLFARLKKFSINSAKNYKKK